MSCVVFESVGTFVTGQGTYGYWESCAGTDILHASGAGVSPIAMAFHTSKLMIN